MPIPASPKRFQPPNPRAGVAALLAFILIGCNGSETGSGSDHVNTDTDAPPPELTPENLASQVAASLAEEESLSMASELRVRPGELALFDYWDALRSAEAPMPELAKLPVSAIAVPRNTGGNPIADALGSGRAWPEIITGLEQEHGYKLVYSHWSHESFDATSNPPLSIVDAEFHFESGQRRARGVVKAKLSATWSMVGPASKGAPPFSRVIVTVIEAAETRSAGFTKIEAFHASQMNRSSLLGPMLVRDLNFDHYPEVLLLGANILLWNQANCTFVPHPIVKGNTDGFRAGVFGDFTGEGLSDLVLADAQGKLMLLSGAKAGAFTGVLKPLVGTEAVPNVSVLAAADIDGDEDTDLFVGQDKPLFVGGQMPSPLEDAIDGNPNFLLQNDGNLSFSDITGQSGLADKRRRRTKDAAFHDINEDGNPDLITASAFSPVDLFLGVPESEERFVDSSTRLLNPNWPLFGTNITVDDFYNRGSLDLYVGGVRSVAALRQNALWKDGGDYVPGGSGAAIWHLRRSGVSNMLVGGSAAPHAGWAFDTAAFDHDNDGDLDLYVTNGYMSGESARDYDSFFWQRELKAGSSLEDEVIAVLYTDEFRPPSFRGLSDGKISWQGHQANRFFRNDGPGTGFTEMGYQEGVALTEDCRDTSATDLDLDGKIDLLVLSQVWRRIEGKLVPEQSLSVLKNVHESTGNWIGFALDQAESLPNANATRIIVHKGKTSQTLPLRDGSLAVHIGLGKGTGFDRAEIHWPDGIVQYIESPKLNTYNRAQLALD